MSKERFLGVGADRPDASRARIRAVSVRAIDIVLSLIGLALSSPLFVIIAILIKLDSKGPIFFSALRVGKDMTRFPMYKFRTMLESAAEIDQSLCPLHDPRVTAAGRILRRTKLNELPQLLNILRGEMSFVGPRPEAPDLLEMYPAEATKIFQVKPGLVGPVVISSLKDDTNGRNEEELYPRGVDPKQYYLEHILPEKVKIDLDYLSHQTVVSYLKIIVSAATETILGAISTRHAEHNRRQIFLFIGDYAQTLASYTLAYLVCMRMAVSPPSFKGFVAGLLLVSVARPVIFYASGLYNLVVEMITPHDATRVTLAVGLGSLSLLALSPAVVTNPYPPLLGLIDFVLLGSALTGIRVFLLRRFRGRRAGHESDRRPRIAIFGANRRGLEALSTLKGSKNGPYNVVGFIDDAEANYAKKIGGVKVLGNSHQVAALSVLHDVQEVILVPDGRTGDRMEEIVSLCARAGVRNRIFSVDAGREALDTGSYPLRPVYLSDVLPQVSVTLDDLVLRSVLPGKTVLMFGSGGELGSALSRYMFSRGCRRLVIVERFESQLNEILSDLAGDVRRHEVVPIVVDSQDSGALNGVFARYRPEIVVHAGMRKFIPFRKIDDEEVARSNYVHTFNLAKAAAAHGCEYFVMISSIRATQGGNFISESLRVAELSLGRFFGQTPTRLIVNRVGNIIENRGGIVSWLNDQILERRSIRLPAETARAFHLSKNAAARSILQALATGSRISPGGLLLTSEPGISLEFSQVARRIASFYGMKIGVDVDIDFGQVSEALIHDDPAVLTAARAHVLAADPLEACLESERVRRIFEDMIYGDTSHAPEGEWQKRTEEIILLCGSTLFSEKKPLPVN